MKWSEGFRTPLQYRHAIMFSRFTAYSGFVGAVLTQSAVIMGGYYLVADGSADGLPSLLIAALLAVSGISLMALARRGNQIAPIGRVSFDRVPVRLVTDAGRVVDPGRRRPAA